MFNLAGNKGKCKLKPIFQSYGEETAVYFEEIDLRENQQIVLLMATMTRREKYIFCFDIYL